MGPKEMFCALLAGLVLAGFGAGWLVGDYLDAGLVWGIAAGVCFTVVLFVAIHSYAFSKLRITG
jgi:predicted Kef-type K+ transport protein